MPIEEFTDKTEMLTETLPVSGFVPFTTAKKSVSWVAGAVFKPEENTLNE